MSSRMTFSGLLALALLALALLACSSDGSEPDGYMYRVQRRAPFTAEKLAPVDDARYLGGRLAPDRPSRPTTRSTLTISWVSAALRATTLFTARAIAPIMLSQQAASTNDERLRSRAVTSHELQGARWPGLG